MEYNAKDRYKGKEVEKYLERRKSLKWNKEQKYFLEIIKKIPNKSKILDIPIGTGRFLDFYHIFNHKVTGFDVSHDMLKKASELSPENLDLKLIQGDAEKTDFTDDSFDFVISARFLNWLPPEVLGNVIKEFSRLSRKGIVIQVRIEERINILEALINMLTLKSIKNTIKILVRKIRGTESSYKDYYIHSEELVLEGIKNFSLVTKKIVDVRYDYLKFKKAPFIIYEFKKK